MIGLVGKKLGMTRIFTEEGTSIPVTIIEVEDNRIVQIKSLKKDGYEAIQVTTGYKKKHRINKAEAGHFSKAGTEVGRGLWEFRIDKCRNLTNIYQKLIVGKNFNIEIFSNTKKVDITGYSKGKGFAGTVKRWNFHTQDATHGNSLSHRVPGSVGQNQTPGKVFKGKKMAGHLGANRVTIQNLKLVSVDNIKKLMIVQGSVPGANGSNLIIKPASKV